MYFRVPKSFEINENMQQAEKTKEDIIQPKDDATKVGEEIIQPKDDVTKVGEEIIRAEVTMQEAEDILKREDTKFRSERQKLFESVSTGDMSFGEWRRKHYFTITLESLPKSFVETVNKDEKDMNELSKLCPMFSIFSGIQAPEKETTEGLLPVSNQYIRFGVTFRNITEEQKVVKRAPNRPEEDKRGPKRMRPAPGATKEWEVIWVPKHKSGAYVFASYPTEVTFNMEHLILKVRGTRLLEETYSRSASTFQPLGKRFGSRW